MNYILEFRKCNHFFDKRSNIYDKRKKIRFLSFFLPNLLLVDLEKLISLLSFFVLSFNIGLELFCPNRF